MFAAGKNNQKKLKSSSTDQTTCETCGNNVRMIPAERAATVCQCSRLKIYRWIEEGDVHYLEYPDGAVMVCGRSLAKKIEDLNSVTNRMS